MPPQKRKAVRTIYDEEVMFKARHRQNCEGRVRDVSEKGLYLFSAEMLPPGTEVIFYLPVQLEKKKALCLVIGKVVRKDLGEPGSDNGYGIEFDRDIGTNSRRQLRKFVSLRGNIEFYETSPGIVIDKNKFALAVKPVEEQNAKAKAKLVRSSARKAEPALDLSKLKKVRGSPQMTVRAKVIWLGIGAVLVATPIYFIARSLDRTAWHQGLTQIVPILHQDVKGDTLHAQIATDWLKETPVHAKRRQLLALGKALREREIYNAVLVNKDGKRVALISRSVYESKQPAVDLF